MAHIILNFHGIGDQPSEREPGESAYWISPGFYYGILDFLVRPVAGHTIELTFDDGNVSDLLIGAEGLARHGLTATFFVLSDRIGLPGSLSQPDIAALVRMGHGIGTHGAAHLDWTKLDHAGFVHELDEARRIISGAAGRPVTAAAIPFGRYNRRVLAELHQRGYQRVYSSDGGPVLSPRHPLPRTSIRGDMTLSDVAALLALREAPVRRLRRRLARLRKAWL